MADRIEVQKTYKLYIGGQFPRTESGRYYSLRSSKGEFIGNVCRSSRKDFRNAVAAARKAHAGWSKKTAYNRGQILYRLAEMLEGRADQFILELERLGVKESAAEKEVGVAVDRLIHYAGWADKYAQMFSTVNPVASSHFNFSIPVSMGVVAIIAPEKSGLLGLLSAMAPAIVGGNTVVTLASQSLALSAISFAEVIHASDVPPGVINILTGERDELLPHMAGHMDVNAILYCDRDDEARIQTVQTEATENVKRVAIRDVKWHSAEGQSPYFILDHQEIQTTWHPIGI